MAIPAEIITTTVKHLSFLSSLDTRDSNALVIAASNSFGPIAAATLANKPNTIEELQIRGPTRPDRMGN